MSNKEIERARTIGAEGIRWVLEMSAHTCQPVSGAAAATVTLPGSKSITNRALVAAALADGTSMLTGVLLAEDTRRMIEALREFGVAVSVDESDGVAEVTGCGGLLPKSGGKIFCGNAGTVMRFCTALASIGHGAFLLDGVERMRQRPIGGLVDALRTLGAGIEFHEREGYPPLTVHAHGLHGGQVVFDSPASSQWISALMLVAPHAGGDVLVEATGDVPSVPYLKMTGAVMQRFGAAVIEQYQTDSVKLIVVAPQRYTGTTFAVEPDASNATYFLAAAAVLGGRVTVEGLGTESVQGDARFVEVLERMGCRVERRPAALTVHGPGEGESLRGVDVDLGEMPDTVQTLAVVALFADGRTTIRHVGNLRVKETDRLTALKNELTKLGATVETTADGLWIDPPKRLTPASIDTYDDHRMAMSFAVAGLRCPGLVIRDPDCCGKTFPDFFSRFAAAFVDGGSTT